MDREINVNLGPIRALEKQIEEHEKAIIRLTERTRDSLLKVSTLLLEILGRNVHYNVIPDGDFGRPSQGSDSFPFVCHRWSEVASRTPELWCSWGNLMRNWTRRYAHHGIVLLDLVLG